jgi:hypothetical protein
MHSTYATFRILTAVLIKIQVFWNVTPCLLVVTDVSKEVAVWRFQSTSHCVVTQTLQMAVQRYSKSPVATDESPWRHILADLNLHIPTLYISMRLPSQDSWRPWYFISYSLIAVRHLSALLNRHSHKTTPPLTSNLSRLGFPAELRQLRCSIISINQIRSHAASISQPLFLFL